MQQVSNSVLSWINWTKVLCLFLIYLFHSETRSHFHVGMLDLFIRPFFVNVFFVLSGYLIVKKQLKPQVKVLSSKIWFNQVGISYLKNILFRIVIPTILFGAILFVPKILMRGGNLDLSDFIRQSIGGCGLWYTPALTVAELLLFCIFIFRVVSPYIIFLFSTAITLLAYWLSISGVEGYPWYYLAGMCSMIFISIGGIYFDLENRKAFLKYQHKKLEYIFLLGILFYLIICIYVPPIRLTSVRISFLGYLSSVFSSLILIHYMKKLPQNKIIDRIGSHTLGLYFLSGAIPEVLCYTIKKITIINSFTILLIAIISYSIGIVLNEFLVKHFPFIFDLRVLSKKAV